MKDDIYTLIVAGKAGEGVKKAAQVIAGILCSRGKSVIQADDYQSLIKGGHNYSTVTASDEDVWATYDKADLIICFDDRSVKEHMGRLNPGGMLIYNRDETTNTNGLALPMTSLMKKHYPAGANVSMSAIAAFCCLCGMERDEMEQVIRKEFKRDIDPNVSYASEVYSLMLESRGTLTIDAPMHEYRFLSGNQAIALGAWKSGLDFYFGYPMTPASSLLHYIALKQSSHKLYAIHAESELSAVNMAIGAALAGCRSAVGSSGGGFALMQESYSAAGMAEVPLLCVLSSRPGPATGVSTYTGQEDLWFALHQGHGEFIQVVASPDNFERAFSLAAELLSLAWEFQIPVILLTEKQLSEGTRNTTTNYESLATAEPRSGVPGMDYARYRATHDGVSPLLFPSSISAPDTVIKWTTHEHLESGLRTDVGSEMVKMKDKRASKRDGLLQAIKRYQQISIYGEAENVVFAYGSTVMELREAKKHCSIPFKIVALIYLEPFPTEALSAFHNADCVVVEHSSSGGFAEYLEWKMKAKVTKRILKYDGRPFDPIDLARQLEEAFNA